MGKIVGVGHGPRISPLPEAAGDYPNEPDYGAEGVTLFQHDCSFLPNDSGVPASHAGQFLIATGGVTSGSRWSVVDGTGPHGQAKEFRSNFPPMMTWHTNGYFDMAGDPIRECRYFYVHYWYLMEGPDFERPLNRLRLGYRGNAHRWSRFGQLEVAHWDGSALEIVDKARWSNTWRDNADGQCVGTESMGPALGFTPGSWHRIEEVWDLGDPDVANGSWSMYLDGELFLSVSDQMLRRTTGDSTTICDNQGMGFDRYRLGQVYNNPGWGDTQESSAGGGPNSPLYPGESVFGGSGTSEQVSQLVDYSDNGSGRTRTVAIHLQQNGTPTDSIVVEFRTGSNTGTLVHSHTITDPQAGWNPFRIGFNLVSSAGTGDIYTIVRRTGSRDTTNYWEVGRSSISGNYLSGAYSLYRRESGSWSQVSTEDLAVVYDMKTRDDWTRFADFKITGIPE